MIVLLISLCLDFSAVSRTYWRFLLEIAEFWTRQMRVAVDALSLAVAIAPFPNQLLKDYFLQLGTPRAGVGHSGKAEFWGPGQ